MRSLGDGVVGRGWVLSFLLTLPLWSVVSGELGRRDGPGMPWSGILVGVGVYGLLRSICLLLILVSLVRMVGIKI
jgi:hypothetical protein